MISGFVDIHMHGCAGFDAGTCPISGLRQMAATLATHGEAGFLPTIPAASFAQTRKALGNIAKAMDEQQAWIQTLGEQGTQDVREALILGAHLEGPFMLPTYKGALDETAFVAATPENWAALTGEYSHIVRRVTVDPLAPGVLDFIPFLTAQGISVTVGHTAATCAQVQEAFAKGATSVTHIYNAMPALHHREPGPVGAALADDDTYAELILDFLHVQPEAAKLVMKAKGTDKVAVITDSCEAAGMPDGPYTLCGRGIQVVNGEARCPDGRLASSTVFMDQEWANILALGFTEADARQMLHAVPILAGGIPEYFTRILNRMYAKTDDQGRICGLIYVPSSSLTDGAQASII